MQADPFQATESNGMNVSFPQAWSDATMGDLLSEQQEVHPMKEIATLGIDLAKNIFQLHVSSLR